MNDICKHEGKRVLLVEGKNDCHVILALCKYYNLPRTFGIYECGSAQFLLKRLNALIIQPNPPLTIGVILDADATGIEARWQQVRDKIKHHGYTFPESPGASGTILPKKEEFPTVGIWLMPDNRKPGMLEDFLLEMAGKEAVRAAEDCVAKAEKKELTSFKPPHHSKAVIHTWLSWQDEPGRPLGQAITTNLLKPETNSAKEFVNWLQQLFNPA